MEPSSSETSESGTAGKKRRWVALILVVAGIAAGTCLLLYPAKPRSRFPHEKERALRFLDRAHLPTEAYWSRIRIGDTGGVELCRDSPAIGDVGVGDLFVGEDGLVLVDFREPVPTAWPGPQPKTKEQFVRFAESLLAEHLAGKHYDAICEVSEGPLGLGMDGWTAGKQVAEIWLEDFPGSEPFGYVEIMVGTGQVVFATYFSNHRRPPEHQ